MVKLTLDLPDDLARWLARRAAGRGCSRQDLVVETLRQDFGRSQHFDALVEKVVEEHRELLRRLAE